MHSNYDDSLGNSLNADRDSNICDNFFVYGSLAQGNIHFQKFFKPENLLQQNAFIRGKVYRLEAGYPALALDGQQMIPGDVVSVQHCDLFLNLMDEFHGFSRKTPDKSLYIRHEVEVYLDEAKIIKAFVYALNPIKLPKNATLIDSGNWIENLSLNPPWVNQLNERQKTYVRKLGNSSGRDIVPIQLELYRELMNLGLIVDKGRRLALSKLGQEVFRFID